MTAPAQLLSLFASQRAAFARHTRNWRERVDALRALASALLEHKNALVEAICADFGGRAAEETLALELFPTLNEIRHSIRHLREWMAALPVTPPLVFRPARARVQYQPLGVVGVMAPWNYPLLLSMTPLAGALGAGNHVILKPSELAPAAAGAMADLLGRTFGADYVAVVQGGPELASEFAALPFDHLLFTGSTRIGRIVMRAASENLTPVTLELGGKSPVIVHESYPVHKAAARIAAGKLYNAGQTCVAPDYALVHAEQVEELARATAAAMARLYPSLAANRDYTRIVNAPHYRRLRALVEDARRLGASILEVNPAREDCNEGNRVMAPVVLTRVAENAMVLEEEIFGPILPVVAYGSLDEAIAYVNRRPRPLALYYFDHSGSRADRVLAETTSGGAAINDCIVQLGVPDLPFGGVGPSGMGRYHGFDGFQTFSHKKAVFLQSRWPTTALLRPPYGATARRLLRLLLRG